MSSTRAPSPLQRRSLPRRVKHALLYAAARALLGALTLLPVRLLLALGPALGAAAFRLARRERQRALANLAAALPALDDAARRRVARDSFRTLGRSAAECLALPRLLRHPGIATAGGLVRFLPGALETLAGAMARGRGVLFVTGHYGNWELLAAAVARHVPAAHVLFKASYDPRFTRLMIRRRARHGLSSIDVGSGRCVVETSAALRAGAAVGVLVDQPVRRGTLQPFLGRLAVTSPLVPILARRTGAAIVVGLIRREGPCQHAISIEEVPVAGGPGCGRAISRITSELLEKAIIERPGEWLWSLDRWRSPELEILSSVKRPDSLQVTYH